MKNTLAVLLMGACLLGLSSCGESEKSSETSQAGTGVVNAEGWDHIYVQTRRPPNDYDIFNNGRFWIYSTPGRWQNAEGPIRDSAVEASINKNTNAAARGALLPEEQCFPAPAGNRVDYEISLVMADKKTKKIIFSNRSSEREICTFIPSQQVATDLAAAITWVINAAEKKDCHRPGT